MTSGVYQRTEATLCQATSKRTGEPCRNHRLVGQDVCRFHGGDVLESKVQRVIEKTLAFGEKMDIHPAEALLDLVQHKAAEVYYWRARVREVEELGLDLIAALQTTKEVDAPIGPEGGGGLTVTQEVTEHIFYKTMRTAERDLATYCAAAMRAGVEERSVRVAEALGLQMLGALEQVMAALDLTPQQQVIAGQVVPQVLRGLSAGSSEPVQG